MGHGSIIPFCILATNMVAKIILISAVLVYAKQQVRFT
jgi:hypothetical protein